MTEPYRIVFNSGGIGSYVTAKRVAAKWGTDKLIHLFNDTRDEDKDLYRFLIETVAAISGISGEAVNGLVAQARALPEEHGPDRVKLIAELQVATTPVIPSLKWQADGRDLWTLFRDQRMIANTRMDVCSKKMKRDQGDRYLKQNHKPDEAICYFGIDHSEKHRFEGDGKKKPGLRNRLLPYRAEAPLCDPPFLTKCEMRQECERDGIDPPRLYDEGFPHNNCGGFCVKSGHAQFLHLLKVRPALFDYHARKEQEVREYLGKDVAVMRDRRGGVAKALPMLEFKRQVESGERKVNPRDWGKGCECFFPKEELTDDIEVGTDLLGEDTYSWGVPLDCELAS